MDSSLVTLKQVGLAFGETVIHRNITLSAGEGEVVTLLGPSGAGKTVILKMIVGLLMPSTGDVRVLGHSLPSLNEEELREVRRNIGMLFQGAALFDSLTVSENIAFPLREFGERSEDKIRKIVADKLDIVGLSGFEARFPAQLSGGQKKRVGLARALASSPKIMLFDEPTTGLDPTATRMIDELIVKLKNYFKITSIAVTHDIESARRISDRWVLINNGTVAADGSVEDVLQQSQDVRSFTAGDWGEA